MTIPKHSSAPEDSGYPDFFQCRRNLHASLYAGNYKKQNLLWACNTPKANPNITIKTVRNFINFSF